MVKFLIMYSNQPPTQKHVHRLKALGEDVSVFVADSEATAIQHAEDVDVILGHRYLRQTLPYTQHLKWVQSTAAGPYHLLSPDLVRISPILTRCPIFSDIVALHAFTLALTILRRIPESVTAQQRGEWVRTPFDMLPPPQSAIIFGLGYIGCALAKLLRQHGITVLGVDKKHSPETKSVCDELLGPTSWRQHLHRADLCFIALPLTKSTANLFDEVVLKALPKHAVLINVSRGGIVNTQALVKLLKEGHLGGAALDVIDPIPKSSADPIWKTPRLLITPKVSVFYPDRQIKLEEFIESQVIRYLNGEELLYKIDINDAIE